MTAYRDKEIAHRLASVDVPPPPPELLDRLKEDIPTLVPAFEAEPPAPSPRFASRGPWLAAASLAVAVLGGFLALRVTEPAPTTTSPPAAIEATSEADSTAGQASSQDMPQAPPQPVQDGVGEKALQGTSEPASESTRGQTYRGASPRVESKESAPFATVPMDSAAVEKESAANREPQRLREELEETRGDLSRRQRATPPRARSAPPPARVPAPEPELVAESDMVMEVPSARSFADTIEVQGEAPANITASAVGSIENRRLEDPKKEGPTRDGRRVGVARRELPKPVAVASYQASTGGTTEPNDQPYGDVFFKHTGTNPFVDTEEDPLSTFGLDVDTGSYGVLRRYLTDGHLPPPEAIRVEEVVNAFDYGDRPPEEGDFALHGEGALTPFAQGSQYRLLRFAVKGREVKDENRKPALLVFVVDVSGSMNRGNRLGLVKKSLGLLLEELRPDDRVGLVVFGNRGEVLLEPTGDLERIRSAIDRVSPNGSTNAEEGLVLGYQQASRFFRNGGINRVILCSDGVANVGRTGADSLLRRIREEAERGIELTTLGFGMGNYNDELMERLADEGDGRYAYLDTLAEARRVLVEDLTGTLQTIASEARAQVKFNPQAVERYRLLGYENRDIPDERFRDDTVDAGEIGAGHTVTVLYEIKLAERVSRRSEIATLHLRYRSAVTGDFYEVSRTIRAKEVQGSWKGASRAFRLASLAAEMAEILKQTYWSRGSRLEDVFVRLQTLSPSFSGSERVAELVSLTGKAARLEEATRQEKNNERELE